MMKRSEQELKGTVPFLRKLCLDDLNRAVALASVAHNGQEDLGKCNYLNHLLRVCNKLRDDEAKTVAILHDVIEDTHVTLAMLAELRFSSSVLVAVDLLTKRPEQDYYEYVARIGQNELASRVKLSDLHDNLDVDGRRPLPAPEKLRDKYIQSRTFLSELYPDAECADTTIEWINP